MKDLNTFLRPEIKAFAISMEEGMRDWGRPKKSWKDAGVEKLLESAGAWLDRLENETRSDEVTSSLWRRPLKNHYRASESLKVLHVASSAACNLMMIADITGSLPIAEVTKE